ncbi:MAG: hypothetical protein QOC95_1940 [Thermoleophilaceae bacterium]|nr:hypothetical protein [Thermoleophilaceae bacterium]
MLDAHQARTATAEGHTKTPDRASERSHDVPNRSDHDDHPRVSRRRDGEHASATGLEHRSPKATDHPNKLPPEPTDTDGAEGAAQPPVDAPVPQAGDPAPAGDVPAPAPGEPETPPVAAVPPAALLALLTPPAPAAPTADPATAPADPAATATATQTMAAAPATPEATSAASTAATAEAVKPDASTPAGTDTDAAQATAAGESAEAASQAQPDGPGKRGAGFGGDGSPGFSAQAKERVAALQAAHVAAKESLPAPGAGIGRSVQPQQAAQQPQQAAAAAQPAGALAPVTAPAPASATAPSAALRNGLPAATPVPLGRTAETVETVLRLAAARGVTHARINLRPAELGAVDVHLRSTSEGLVARVVAHSPEAVQTLQQAAGDLRRSLEEQGLTLLNLDIGQSGERSAGRSDSNAGGLGRGNRRGPDGLPTDAQDNSTTETTLRLPNGVLVDVLA